MSITFNFLVSGNTEESRTMYFIQIFKIIVRPTITNFIEPLSTQKLTLGLNSLGKLRSTMEEVSKIHNIFQVLNYKTSLI